MNRHSVTPRRRARRSDAAERAKILAAFEGSGLSAAAFARQEGIHYTTFCGWRSKQNTAPAFIEVQLDGGQSAAELVIELGGPARCRLTAPEQIPLAARLLQSLRLAPPCSVSTRS